MHLISFIPLTVLLSTLPSFLHAHGYLSSPPPRGIEKAGYQIDDLKSPNTRGLCRGEPAGKITHVKPGQSLKLGLTITAPHTGPCALSILDEDLTNEVQVAEKYDCAAPGGPGFWVVKLPSNISGRKVLRWYWEGRHIPTTPEKYEQCIDVVFGSQADGEDYDGQGENEDNANSQVVPKPKGGAPPRPKPSPAPRPVPPTPRPSGPSYSDGQGSDNSDSNYDGEKKRPEHSRGGSKHGNRPHRRSSSSGSCSDGSYRCTRDGGFEQCANKAWVKMACSAGTACKQTGKTIVCDSIRK